MRVPVTQAVMELPVSSRLCAVATTVTVSRVGALFVTGLRSVKQVCGES
jgi:hypothetical protein